MTVYLENNNKRVRAHIHYSQNLADNCVLRAALQALKPRNIISQLCIAQILLICLRNGQLRNNTQSTVQQKPSYYQQLVKSFIVTTLLYNHGSHKPVIMAMCVVFGCNNNQNRNAPHSVYSRIPKELAKESYMMIARRQDIDITEE